MNKEQIILTSDHAGYALKEAVKKFLLGEKYAVLDIGAHELVPEDDYPVYMSGASLKVAEDIAGNTKAILFGGSGEGEAIVANRYPGVRAVVYYGGGNSDKGDIIELSRKHNNSNVLSLGAWFVDTDTAVDAVKRWLETPFSGEDKHERRLGQIDSL